MEDNRPRLINIVHDCNGYIRTVYREAETGKKKRARYAMRNYRYKYLTKKGYEEFVRKNEILGEVEEFDSPEGKVYRVVESAVNKSIMGTAKTTKLEEGIKPIFNVFHKHYSSNPPRINLSILDIEVDRDVKRGFADPWYPYAPITAYTFHHKRNADGDMETVTGILAPPGLAASQCRLILDGDGDEFGRLTENDGYIVYDKEHDLIFDIMKHMQDCDVVSGWNSETYDIVYIINRMRHVIGNESLESIRESLEKVKRAKQKRKIGSDVGEDGEPDYFKIASSYAGLKWLGFTNESCTMLTMLDDTVGKPSQRIDNLKKYLYPQIDVIERFGKQIGIYRLAGKVHLDYMELYKKFAIYNELPSYSLDYVLNEELGIGKVGFEGSLDALYRSDIRRYTAYNRQDVMGLSKLDDKKKLVDLAYMISCDTKVHVSKTLGTVSMVDHAITAHARDRGFIMKTRNLSSKGELAHPIPGAYVMDAKPGIFRDVFVVDYNSLYPTIIRMLNLSPETIVGYLDISRFIKEVNRSVSRHETASSAWKKHGFPDAYKAVIDGDEDRMVFLVNEKGGGLIEGTGKEIRDYLVSNGYILTPYGLVLDNSKKGIIPELIEGWYFGRKQYQRKADELKTRKENGEEGLDDEINYYDMLSMVKKIQMNSLYGALGNVASMFFDIRVASSITLAGRVCLMELIEASRETALEVLGND